MIFVKLQTFLNIGIYLTNIVIKLIDIIIQLKIYASFSIETIKLSILIFINNSIFFKKNGVADSFQNKQPHLRNLIYVTVMP